MNQVAMAANPQHTENTIAAVKIVCTCGDPQSHIPDPCPQGRRVNLGVLSYHHPNPIRRLTFRIAQRLARRVNMILIEEEK